MDIVANAVDFTRQYKMRLRDIVFGKESKRIRRKNLPQMQPKRTPQENWETGIFLLFVCFLYSVGYENSYYIQSYLCVKSYEI